MYSKLLIIKIIYRFVSSFATALFVLSVQSSSFYLRSIWDTWWPQVLPKVARTLFFIVVFWFSRNVVISFFIELYYNIKLEVYFHKHVADSCASLENFEYVTGRGIKHNRSTVRQNSVGQRLPIYWIEFCFCSCVKINNVHLHLGLQLTSLLTVNV